MAVQQPALDHIKDVIILSMFDGMGSAAFACGSAVRGPSESLVFIWEVDTPFNRVSRSLFQGLRSGRHHRRRRDVQGDGWLWGVPSFGARWLSMSRLFETCRSQHQWHIIVKNVVMNRREDVDLFSQKLKASPTLLHSSDVNFRIISRPHLFWSRLGFA